MINNVLNIAAKLPFSERLAEAGRVMLFGMVMVFAVLAALWGILAIMKVIMVGKDPKPEKAVKEEKKEKPVSTPEPVKAPAPVAKAPEVPVSDDGALIAVITAAVAAYIASEDPDSEYAGGFRVVSFRRVSGRGAWNSKR